MVSFSGRGRVTAKLSVELADPATMAPGTVGMVLSRWLSGDVSDEKRQMYDTWVAQIIFNHRNRSAIVSPQGSYYVDALAFLLDKKSDSAARIDQLVVAREMAERLCTGGLTIVVER